MSGFIERRLGATARAMLQHAPGLVIEGARQVGKTTLAQALAPDAVVYNLDDEAVRAAAEADMQGLIERAGDRPIIVDEVQRHAAVTLPIKAAIDRDRRPGRFILTGSASYLRVRGLADSLAGRVIRLPLYGLSQGELSGSHDDFVSAVIAGPAAAIHQFSTNVRRADYATAIGRGAYPEIRDADGVLQRRWLDSYVNGLLRRDLGELRRDVSPARAESILRTLAGSQAAELVKARLAEHSGIPASTVTGYLDMIVDLGLLHLVPPWTPHLAKREIGRPKSVLLDSGLALRLTRMTSEQLDEVAYGEALGSFLEAFVAAELVRQRSWTEEEFEVFHYRDRAGVEVDLILELTGGRVIAVEVKAATTFRSSHFAGLRKLRDQLGDRFIAGIVLNTGSSGYQLDDRLFGLPVAALWQLGR